jgi:poly(ADP-ribose) glycohydrolase ARH3
VTKERFAGCLLGLALGDALGAPYEGGPLERLLWKAIGKTRHGRLRFTDDTQMALDLAASLLARGELAADDLARRLAAGYRWHRGYGPGARKLLLHIRRGQDWRRANRAVYADGSFGNGAAVRAPVVGLVFSERPGELLEAARLSAAVTHAHPRGLEGAVLVATAVARALHSDAAEAILAACAAACADEAFTSRCGVAASWLRSSREVSPAEVARALGNGMAAHESCVSALYLALRFLARPFEEMLAFASACRGDVDSLAAMAGAVWGAARGRAALPAAALARIEDAERIEDIARALHALHAAKFAHGTG